MDAKSINKLCTICRLCLKACDLDKYFYINGSFENVLIKEMIEKCAPEMDCEISENPVLCLPCCENLRSAYIFKTTFYETEERIYWYMEENNLKVGTKIILRDLQVQAKEEDIEIKIEDIGNGVQSPSETSDAENDVDNKVIELSDSSSDAEEIYSDINLDFEEKINNSKVEDTIKANADIQISKISKYLKRSYTCKKCEYKAYRYDLLKKHMANKCKYNFKPKKHQCQYCSFSSKRKRQLDRHLLTHGGKRPYTCEHCGRGYTEKHQLRDHLYKRSKKTMPFKCNRCEKPFARKCDLNSHERKSKNCRGTADLKTKFEKSCKGV